MPDALTQKLIKGAKNSTLRELTDDLHTCEDALKALHGLKFKVYTNLVQVVSSLTPWLQACWKALIAHLCWGEHHRLPNLADFTLFVEEAVEENENAINGILLKRKPSSSKDSSSKGRQQASSYGTTTKVSCLHCSKTHIILKWEEFKTIDLEQRVQTLLTKEACFICLKPGHHSKEYHAKDKNKCKKGGCGRRYHTWMHGYDVKRL